MFLDFNRIVKYNTYPDICLFLDIEPNRSFEVEGYPYRIYQIDNDGNLVDIDWDDECDYMPYDARVLCDMFKDPSSIHYIQKWTSQDIEDAKNAKRFHPEMNYVRRLIDKGSSVALYKVEDPEADYGLRIDADCFPSLRRTECVKLDDIINWSQE